MDLHSHLAARPLSLRWRLVPFRQRCARESSSAPFPADASGSDFPSGIAVFGVATRSTCEGLPLRAGSGRVGSAAECVPAGARAVVAAAGWLVAGVRSGVFVFAEVVGDEAGVAGSF